MEWRTDFENAPRGETEVRTFRHHQSGKIIEKDLVLKVPILLSVGNQVLQSHWSDTRQQWVGLAKDQRPDGWQRWPRPMKALDR